MKIRERNAMFAVLLATGALVIPAQALSQAGFSGVRHYKGPVSQPGNEHQVGVEFDVQFERGQPVKVRRLVESNIIYRCANGKWYLGGVGNASNSRDWFPHAIKVNRGRFSGKTDRGSLVGNGIAVTGRIPRHGPATGTIRYFDDRESENCDSGRLSWSARPK
jgi:hypothetical protein